MSGGSGGDGGVISRRHDAAARRRHRMRGRRRRLRAAVMRRGAGVRAATPGKRGGCCRRRCRRRARLEGVAVPLLLVVPVPDGELVTVDLLGQCHVLDLEQKLLEKDPFPSKVFLIREEIKSLSNM